MNIRKVDNSQFTYTMIDNNLWTGSVLYLESRGYRKYYKKWGGDIGLSKSYDTEYHYVHAKLGQIDYYI